MCAYLRYYYPLEFLTASFNTIESEDDIASCSELANLLKIKILPPKFRYSKSEYFMDKNTNSIYKGIASIKYLSEDTANYLYSLKDINFKNFSDLLYTLDSKYINARQIDILIKLDFFSEFGNIKSLLRIVQFYNIVGKAKILDKNKISEGIIRDIILKNSKETEKRYTNIDNKNIMNEIESYVKMFVCCEDFSIKEKILWQKEYIGYIDIQTGKEEDRTKLIISNVVPLKSKKTNKVWAYSLETISIGSGKKSEVLVYNETFDKMPLKVYDIIKVNPKSLSKKEYNGRSSWYLYKYKVILV